MAIDKTYKIDLLINQLDLTEHIEQFKSFFSRESSLYIEGDQELHYRYIKALDNIEFKAPPKVADFFTIKSHLKKHGVLNFEQIFEIVPLVMLMDGAPTLSQVPKIVTCYEEYCR